MDRVFCASLADVFDDHPSIERQWRMELHELIYATPNLIWMLLTKRPENIARYLPYSLVTSPRVWLGVTAENQERYNERATILATLPREEENVRFLSCEPLLGPIQFGSIVGRGWINWVIVGGESGGDFARPMSLLWVGSILAQCRRANVPFFFKQMVNKAPRAPEWIIEEVPDYGT
jgi:protein gp37